MDWKKIEESYKRSAKILMEETEETRTGCKDGIGKSPDHLTEKRRSDIVRLRMSAEFFLKALYINREYSVFRFKNSIVKIEDLSEPQEIDLDKTHDFSVLIAKLGSIIADSDIVKSLKNGLNDIRTRGNEAIHGAEFSEELIQEARTTIETLQKQFD